MQTHGPSCLEGPVSGTRTWWQMPETPRDTASSQQKYRADLVARVRSAIAAGTYDTPEKWEIALSRLLDDLDAREQAG